jgi:NADPH:quinone reductase-like Zn-dependent oxidoreductase
MQAVVFDEHGGTEVLQYKETPVPEISPTEVLIRVKATALNYNDIWARKGVPGIVTIFPHISGSDVCGVVEAVGSGVKNVGVGDEVLVSLSISCGKCDYCLKGESLFCSDFRIWGFQTGPLDGGQAEYAKLPATNVVPKPDNLTDEEAASMALVLGTAWRMLVTRANVRPGDFVLVWGAAGGLGCMAIQICRLFNARVIAVVSSDEKLKLVEDLGAEYVVQREKQRVLREVQKITNRRGVDIVFEHVGSASWETSMYALKWGGAIVLCGATTGFNVSTDLRLLWNKQQNYLGSHSFTTAELVSALRFVQSGHIKPVVSQVLPLKEIARGHEMIETGEVIGKIVMVP